MQPLSDILTDKDKGHKPNTGGIMDVQITKLDETQPHQLYAHYQGQTDRQDAYIALDLRDGRMWAHYNPEIGNAVPMSVYHRAVQRWYMPPFRASTANRIMDTIASLAQAVLDGATVEWDGSNNVGRLTEDATDAVEKIGIEINTWADDASDDICWQPGREWWDEDICANVTAGLSDAEIERIVDDAIAETRMESPAAVIDRDEIIGWYRQHRDELRDEEARP